MSVPHSQLAIIHVAKQQLGLSEADYRRLLRDAAGVESSRSLTPAGFKAVMAAFSERGFVSYQVRRSFGRRAGMATPAQVAYLRKLWTEYTGGENESSLQVWLEHYYHVSHLRFVNAAIAGKAIVALKSMMGRQALNQQTGA